MTRTSTFTFSTSTVTAIGATHTVMMEYSFFALQAFNTSNSIEGLYLCNQTSNKTARWRR